MAKISLKGKYGLAEIIAIADVLESPTIRPSINWKNKIIPTLEIIIEGNPKERKAE